jgi:hypothetical protein
MWSGTNNNFDATGMGIDTLDGWALCNGNHSTPDLRGRFIVGATNVPSLDAPLMPAEVNPSNKTDGINNPNYSINNKGGKSFHKLNTNEYGLLNHKHGNSLKADSTGAHAHSLPYAIYHINNISQVNDAGEGARPTRTSGNFATTTNSVGVHAHSISGEIENASIPVGNAHENRPPYYVLAFIMRIK